MEEPSGKKRTVRSLYGPNAETPRLEKANKTESPMTASKATTRRAQPLMGVPALTFKGAGTVAATSKSAKKSSELARCHMEVWSNKDEAANAHVGNESQEANRQARSFNAFR